MPAVGGVFGQEEGPVGQEEVGDFAVVGMYGVRGQFDFTAQLQVHVDTLD